MQIRTRFSACNENYIDAEWKLQEAYYKAQGCEVELSDELDFQNVTANIAESLEHEFENLIEEVKSERKLSDNGLNLWVVWGK
jgi:hypothetical protein